MGPRRAARQGWRARTPPGRPEGRPNRRGARARSPEAVPTEAGGPRPRREPAGRLSGSRVPAGGGCGSGTRTGSGSLDPLPPRVRASPQSKYGSEQEDPDPVGRLRPELAALLASLGDEARTRMRPVALVRAPTRGQDLRVGPPARLARKFAVVVEEFQMAACPKTPAIVLHQTTVTGVKVYLLGTA